MCNLYSITTNQELPVQAPMAAMTDAPSKSTDIGSQG
jgi:hypothetical protein